MNLNEENTTAKSCSMRADLRRERGSKRHWRFARIDWKEALKHLAFAVCAGVVCGLASVVLCIVVGWAFDIFRALPWLIWLLPVMGIIQLLVYKRWKIPQDLTTHRVVIYLREDKPISALLAPGILFGTATTIVSGGSVGKEAAALQMGASLGTLVSRPFKVKSVYAVDASESMSGYVAALGMAAQFSALFFAPLGSALFVMELSRFKRSINKHIGSIVVACFVAFLVSSTIGIGDYVDRIDPVDITWLVVAQCIVIGVATALMGSVFDSAIKWIHDITWRITKNFYVWVVAGGLIFATLVTLFGWQAYAGSGGSTLNDALSGHFDMTGFAIKALLTLICLGFWFKGGEITPSFCIGGLLGATCSSLIGGDIVFGVAVGVITFFAAFSRCPLAAFVMGCEILGWYMAPYIAIGVFVAYNFSSPVGMYGDGVDRALRVKWHDVISGVTQRRIDGLEKADSSAIASAQEMIDDVKKEIVEDTSKPS